MRYSNFPALLLLLVCVLIGGTVAGHEQESSEGLKISPDKIAQLNRMQPVTTAKIKILVAAGQLTKAQADLISKWIQPDGSVFLPKKNIGIESAPKIAVALDSNFQNPDGSLNVLAYLRNEDKKPLGSLSPQDIERFRTRLRGYTYAGRGERLAIRKELLAAGPGANPIIAATFREPIDMIFKLQLWGGIARAKNPRAAGYIALTHQNIMNEASPVLVPYAKDIGGLILRRKQGGQAPFQRWYSSRDLREIVLDLERLISHCSGIRAVSYLIDVYAARYEANQAPMRDKKRDRYRMVQACGGDKKHFDQDEPKKWGCTLGNLERAMIAERLVENLRSKSGSQRQIAMNGLMIVLKVSDKKLKKRLEKAHKNWPAFQQWYGKQRERLLRK